LNPRTPTPLVLITHNHQDHILFETLLQIRHKVSEIIVPRGGSGMRAGSLSSAARKCTSTPWGRPIVESNKLIEACRRRQIVAERLFGEKEIPVDRVDEPAAGVTA
jgi:hypothetical protein